MAEIGRMDAEQEALCSATDLATFKRMMTEFGRPWIADEHPPEADLDAIQRARRAYAVPVSQGAAMALARFSWETAPPGATHERLVDHLAGILRNAAHALVADFPNAGGFWRAVASRGLDRPGEAEAGVSLGDQLAAARRELKMRQSVYPRRVSLRKMTPQLADRETRAMAAIVATLEALEEGERLV